MPRNTTIIASDYQRTRTQESAFQRGESRLYTVEFRALIPDGQSIAYAEWWCLRPDVTYMTDAKCADTSTSINLESLNTGYGAMKCQVTLTDGSRRVQMACSAVDPAPWFYPNDQSSLPNSPTYLRADNLGVLMLYGDAPSGMVGTAYSYAYTANGGTPPYTFSIVGGVVPSGLSLSSSGVLSGTPTAQGNYSWTVEVTDSRGASRTLPDDNQISAKPTYQDYIISQGPDLFYPMNDSTTTCVELIQGLNGTYAGAGVTRQNPPLMPNGQGGSARFATLVDLVNIPSNSVIPAYDKPFTMEWWSKFESLPTNGPPANGANILGILNSGGTPLFASLTYDRQLRAGRTGAGSGNLVTANGGPLVINTTQHYVVVFDTDKSYAYVNGSLIFTTSTPIEPPGVTSAVSYQIMGPFLSGDTGSLPRSVQNVAVYKRALSAATVLEHYNMGLT